MGGEPDEVILSEWERERLAGIEQALATSDPGLTRTLVRGRRPVSTRAVAVALVVLGAVLVLGTFTRWLWLAAVGLAVMAAGMFLGSTPILARLKRLGSTRRPVSPGD